jgi:hypothetical protein
MKINNRILLFYVLPTLAPLILPPPMLLNGIGAVILLAALLLISGYFLQRGKPLALTFIILLQGLNFIIKMMLFFSTTISAKGVADWAFGTTALLSMALSFYLIFRLDQGDVRAQLK